jgi:hypothetical protein
MAQYAVILRLDRLRHGPRLPGKLRRTVSCGLAGAAAVTLPFVAGTGFLLGIAAIACQ